jgi:hypothetical protein
VAQLYVQAEPVHEQPVVAAQSVWAKSSQLSWQTLLAHWQWPLARHVQLDVASAHFCSQRRVADCHVQRLSLAQAADVW